MSSVCIAAEGACDALAARKIAEDAGLSIGTIYDCRGKPGLDKRLNGFLSAAQFSGWIILRDLDADAECAPGFLQGRSIIVTQYACLRLPVRSLEAWLLADMHGLAGWLKVKPGQIPASPEELDWPKRELANLAARSRSSAVRERMAPRPGDGSIVGPEYGAALYEFIDQVWNFRAAAASGKAPSLARAIACIRRLQNQLQSVNIF